MRDDVSIVGSLAHVMEGDKHFVRNSLYLGEVIRYGLVAQMIEYTMQESISARVITFHI